jgi:hypothetical protein
MSRQFLDEVVLTGQARLVNLNWARITPGLYHYELEIPYASDAKEAEKMLAHLRLRTPDHRDYPSKCGQYEICAKVSLLWDSQFILLTVMMK